MVDEFQDSNPRQLALFERARPRRPVRRRRRAAVDLRLPPRRRRASSARAARALARARRVATLATNFRSRRRDPRHDQRRVRAAPRRRASSRCARAARGRATAPARRSSSCCSPTRPAGTRPTSVDLGELPRARGVAPGRGARCSPSACASSSTRGDARPEEIVVLLRAARRPAVYERALEDQGLLTLSVGGRGYWGRQVVRDLCAWLAALANPRDETALYGVLASPLVGAVLRRARARRARRARQRVARDARRLARAAERRRRRCSTRLRAPTTASARAFARRASPPSARSRRASALDELLAACRRRTGYDLHVLSLPGGARRLANIHKLLRLGARASSATTAATCAASPTSRAAELEARGARDRRAGRGRRRQGRAADVDPRRQGPGVPGRLRRRPRARAPRPARDLLVGATGASAAARRPDGASAAGARLPRDLRERAREEAARRSASCTSR